MLTPHDRRLLVEALRPPPGFVLERAIGTTYTLDLVSLLVTPLAFTFFAWEEERDGIPADPLLILEALRRNADRVTVFCQAGEIAVPGQHRVLFHYLEDSVVEVTAPRSGGVFHPKLWILRFETPEGRVRYRLLVLSRNLTFDRSWDTIMALEGSLRSDRTNAFSRNHPLGDFVSALPDLAHRPISRGLRQDVERMQDELRRVEFELPEEFGELRFWPLGVPGHQDAWPFDGRTERTLIVSPFLSASVVERVAGANAEHVLVSRLDELERLTPEAFGRFDRVCRLSPNADVEEDDAEEPSDDLANEVPDTGLHAKLYVADVGWDARLWTGSANATQAAFGANVEFLVELVGRKSSMGVDAILGGPEGTPTLNDLLEEVPPPPDEPPPEPTEEVLEDRLRRVRLRMATMDLEAQAAPAEDDEYELRVHRLGEVAPAPEGGVEMRIWPITLPEDVHGIEPDFQGEVLADFGRCSVTALTTFFAVELVAREAGVEVRSRFVLNLPLQGAPADRAARTLESLLTNRQEVIRFLLLLLSEEGLDDSSGFLDPTLSIFGDLGRWTSGDPPLFETLMKALDRSPRKIDEINHVLSDLRKTDKGRSILPERIDEIWAPIWEARQRVGDS